MERISESMWAQYPLKCRVLVDDSAGHVIDRAKAQGLATFGGEEEKVR